MNKLIDKYLTEGYTKKSAVSNSDKIAKELYDLVSSNERVRQHMDVMSSDIKPNMFKIKITKHQAGLSHYAKKPATYRGGVKRGRKNTRSYDYITIMWYDSFWKDYRDILFLTAKEFNRYLDELRQMAQ